MKLGPFCAGRPTINEMISSYLDHEAEKVHLGSWYPDPVEDLAHEIALNSNILLCRKILSDAIPKFYLRAQLSVGVGMSYISRRQIIMPAQDMDNPFFRDSEIGKIGTVRSRDDLIGRVPFAENEEASKHDEQIGHRSASTLRDGANHGLTLETDLALSCGRGTNSRSWITGPDLHRAVHRRHGSLALEQSPAEVPKQPS